MIADVPAGLPTPAIPSVGFGEIGALSSGALALALVALAESIGTARSLAAQRGYEIDPNQELVALGASNVGAGLLQGFPVDASLSRSAVGAGAGVRTRLSGLFVAAPARGDDALPDAALRRAAAGDARRDHHRRRRRARRRQRVPLAVADRPGRRAARDRRVRGRRAPRRAARDRDRRRRLAARADPARVPAPDRRPRPRRPRGEHRRELPFRSVDRHPEYETIPGLVLFRFANELFFANASYFRDETLRLVDESDPPARTVLVDASVISHADTTALAMLDDLLDQLAAQGRDARVRAGDGPTSRSCSTARGSATGSGPMRSTARCTPASRRSCAGRARA